MTKKIKLMKVRRMLNKILADDRLVICPAFQVAFHSIFAYGCTFTQESLGKCIQGRNWQIQYDKGLPQSLWEKVFYHHKQADIELVFGDEPSKVKDYLYELSVERRSISVT